MLTVLAAVGAVSAAAKAQSNPITVDLQYSPMEITLSAEGNTLVEITEFQFGSKVVNTIYGERTEGGSTFIDVGDGMEIEIAPVNRGIRFYAQGSANVSITMNDLGDHYYGVTEQIHTPGHALDLRGVTMDVGMMQTYSNNESFASGYSACYMSTRGYGSFFDSFAHGQYSFAVSGETTLTHYTGTLDWYLFYGPEGQRIHQGFFDVIGHPRPVPMWAMGPTIWRNDNTGSAEILNDADAYTQHQLAVTHLWVDRPYSNGSHGWSDMDFASAFSNPSSWIGTLKDTYGIVFSTWISPALFGGTSEVPDHLGGQFTYIDLSTPASKSWYKNKLNNNQYVHGVHGHKIDRLDEHWNNITWAVDSPPVDERWNTYLELHSKTVWEALYAAHGDDQFTFARAAYHRVQPYLHAIWGGDTQGDWAGMRDNMGNAMNSSYQGFPIWGADCTGYWNTSWENDELSKRWLQWCAWNGMFEIKIDATSPGGMSSSLRNVFREACEVRMELMPYNYSLANTSDRTGVMMRPMTYDFPFDPECVNHTDQYLLGPSFLVAPIFSSGQTSRDVYLPPGQQWIDFYDTGQSYSGGQTVSMAAPTDRIPVLVKQNTIYPRGLIYAGNMEHWMPTFDADRYMDVYAFPGAVGQSDSFTYVDYLDGNTEKTLSVDSAPNGITISFPAMTVGGTIYVWLDETPQSLHFNGSSITPDYNSSTNLLSVPYPPSQSTTLIINGGVAMPQFSPQGGYFDAPQDVTITCSDPCAAIYYTTNGTDPTETNGTLIASGATVAINANTTLKARAFKPGEDPSVLVSDDYVIDTESPSTPGVPVAEPITANSIGLTWAQATDNEAVSSYRLFRNSGTLAADIEATTYTDTTVMPCGDYSYAVQAVDQAGNASAMSAYSEIAHVPALPQAADLDDDGDVDMGDLAVLAEHWLQAFCGASGDLNSDEVVNLEDFSHFAADWGLMDMNNVLLNPSFEDGMTHWSGPSGGGIGQLASDYSHNGTYSFNHCCPR